MNPLGPPLFYNKVCYAWINKWANKTTFPPQRLVSRLKKEVWERLENACRLVGTVHRRGADSTPILGDCKSTLWRLGAHSPIPFPLSPLSWCLSLPIILLYFSYFLSASSFLCLSDNYGDWKKWPWKASRILSNLRRCLIKLNSFLASFYFSSKNFFLLLISSFCLFIFLHLNLFLILIILSLGRVTI